MNLECQGIFVELRYEYLDNTVLEISVHSKGLGR